MKTMTRWLLPMLLLSGVLSAQTTPVVVATTVACATSVDGSVVGLPNPLNPPVVAAAYTGTLPAGNYYVENGWYDSAGHVTLVGPEVQIQLTSTGQLQINLPTSGMPSAAVGMNIYIGTSSGTETLQGQSTGSATFTQSTPLATGTAVPATNNTVCAIVANDAGWPTGTGYAVSMTTPAGDTMPGYPMQWQLLGPGTTINLGQGLPLYNGTVSYPIPILARPYNHASQSISGPLSMTGYNLTQVAKLGVGTSVPGWPVDVENGAVNASGGYIVNGGTGVTTGQCLAAGSDPYHTFNVTVPCVSSIPTAFYQTVAANGTAQTQRPVLNFASRLTVTDSASPAQTTVDLTAVGAGASCTLCNITYDAYGRVVSSSSSSSVITFTQTDATGSRALGTTYQNTSGAPMLVQGYITTTAGGADGNVACSNGSTVGLGNTPFSQNPTATDAGGSAEFHLQVPAGWYYKCTASGTMNPSLAKWFETVL